MIYSQKLEDELTTLQTISNEQQKSIKLLLKELTDLRIRLNTSRSLLEKHKKRAGELLSTITLLEEKLKRLSESFDHTEQAWRKYQIAIEKELRQQKIKTVLYIILAGAVSGAAGYIIGSVNK